MKILKLLLLFIAKCVFCGDKPTVTVNYLPKKQWKLSKHDIADIKLDIERELKDRIITIQREWELRERNQQFQLLNQGVQYPLYIPPVNYYPSYPNIPINNLPINNLPNNVGLNYDHIQRHNHPHDHVHEHYSIHELMDKLDHVIQDESKKGLSKFMKETLTEVKGLKEQLEKLKSERDNETPHITNEYHLEPNITVPDNKSVVLQFKQLDIPEERIEPFSHHSSVNSIINKYRSNEALGKLNLFLDMSKKMNHTNIRKIDVRRVSEKIDEVASKHKEILSDISKMSIQSSESSKPSEITTKIQKNNLRKKEARQTKLTLSPKRRENKLVPKTILSGALDLSSLPELL